ncbi:MAG: YybH family protein [Rhizomicrobium sp.]
MIRRQQPSMASVCAAASVIGVAVMFISLSAPAAENDTAAVLAANAQFYAALNKMFVGELAPIVAVWSHADDVTYMGPTGNFEHGWSAVLKDWKGQAAMKLGGKVAPVDAQVIAGRDVAVVNDYEEGENTNAQGKVVLLKLRATNIFRKEGGQWKMVGHHTDPLPYLAK